MEPLPQWAGTIFAGELGVTDGYNKPVREPVKIAFYEDNGQMPDECKAEEVIEVIEQAEVKDEVVTQEIVVEIEPELSADQKFWIKHRDAL